MENFLNALKEFYGVLMRRKSEKHMYMGLHEKLDLFDSTVKCIGFTIGVGPYVFIGLYSQLMGPGMVFAYILAGLIALLSALCYAELICRGGCGGGAYSSLYRTIGECPAVTAGCLAFVQRSASAAIKARVLANLIDTYFDASVSSYITDDIIEFNYPLVAKYPSFKAFIIVILAFIIVILAFIINMYLHNVVTRINIYFVFYNFFMLCLVVIVMGSMADLKYWRLPSSVECGRGGFIPYGIERILENTALVYFVYLGFDHAAHSITDTTASEGIIPLAMLSTIISLMVLYTLQALAYSLTWNYCDVIPESTALVKLLFKWKIQFMYHVCKFGIPLIAVCTLLTVAVPMSKILQAISNDGLFFVFMAKVSIQSKTPTNALIVSGILTAFLAFFLNTRQLLELTCLSSILLCNLVAFSIMYLRFTDSYLGEIKNKSFVRKLFNLSPKSLRPTRNTSKIAAICCVILLFSPYASIIILRQWHHRSQALINSVLLIVVHTLILYILTSQPKSQQAYSFMMKPHTFLSFFTILINTYLSLTFNPWTWVRCAIFLGAGLFIYFTYGISHSRLSSTAETWFY